MGLKKEDLGRLAQVVVKNLKERTQATFRLPEPEVCSKIEAVLLKNLAEEAAIEEEVRRIMEQYKSQIASGTIDPQKAYMMIKKQVAKERKFIL